MLKKSVFFVFAAASAAVGIASLPTTKIGDGMFYIALAVILALFPFTSTKDQKQLLIVLGFVCLFTALGLQAIIDGNLLFALGSVAVAAAIIYKERSEIAGQYRQLTQ